MDLGLDGAGVLVTGASRGLGRAIALAFAAEGARVALSGRDRQRLEDVAGEISALGSAAFVFARDLTVAGAASGLVSDAAAALGRLDVLVNNASADVLGAAGGSLSTVQALQARINGKALVAVECSYAAVPYFVESGGGSITMIGGTSTRQAFSADDLGTEASTMASGFGNAALTNFAGHLAKELAAHRIRVNTVHPHQIVTDRYAPRLARLAERNGLSLADAQALLESRIPLGQVPTPTDVAPLVVFLSSPLAALTTGQSLVVDGGAVAAVSY